MKVKHKKFGLGEIVKIDSNKMDVHFSTSIKTFLYPDSFEKFFVIQNEKAQEYIDKKLIEVNDLKRVLKEKQNKRLRVIEHSHKLLKKENVHAVFAMRENSLEDVFNKWNVNTGCFVSGKCKGFPRIPEKLGLNSACILTRKRKDEEERSIIGIFMVEEDFLGRECNTGIIPAHKKYRIIWNEDNEKLLLWSYFPESLRPKKWGPSEIKYISKGIVKQVIEEMIKYSENEEQDEIIEFYRYFLKLN